MDPEPLGVLSSLQVHLGVLKPHLHLGESGEDLGPKAPHPAPFHMLQPIHKERSGRRHWAFTHSSIGGLISILLLLPQDPHQKADVQGRMQAFLGPWQKKSPIEPKPHPEPRMVINILINI